MAPVNNKAASSEKKGGYVPPPPAGSEKLPAPAGMPKVKEYPVSSGAPPASMDFPGLKSAASAPAAGDGDGGSQAPEAEAAPADDGFTPEERRKNELEEDPGFKKYLMMRRMKIPHYNIRAKIRDTEQGKYTVADIDLFADKHEIEEANYMKV